MAIVLDGTTNTVTPLNGALGATTPSTVVATTVVASSTIKGATTIAVGNATPSASGAVTATKITQSAAPCFGAYLATVSVPHNSAIELTPTEIYDPTNAYATNGRFTPQTAGYYLVSGVASPTLSGTGTIVTSLELVIAKNGSSEFTGLFSNENTGMINYVNVSASKVIYLNGTTDYVSLKAYQYNYSGSGAFPFTRISFQAHLIGV